MIPLAEIGRDDGFGERTCLGRIRRHEVDVEGYDVTRELRGQARDVDPLHLFEIAVGRIGELAEGPVLRRTDAPDDGDRAGRHGRDVARQGEKAPVDDQDPAVVEPERYRHIAAGPPALGAIHDEEDLVGEVHPGGRDRAPLDLVEHRVAVCGTGRHELVEGDGRLVVPGLDRGVEGLALVEPPQLPEPEVHHRHDRHHDEQVERHPLRTEEEPIHLPRDATEPESTADRSEVVGRVGVMELPDFHIPHAEKIEWMIETNGWALEPVAPCTDTDPPVPSYGYTIGVPALTGFAEIAVFGLTPVATNGLVGLVIDALRGGTEIPVGVELVGLLDNDLRCVFAPVDLDTAGDLFGTARSWYRGEPYPLVQLVYPDRNGFMPYEPGFDQRKRFAQPLVGSFES